MKLIEEIGIDIDSKQIISIVGAGGKTTTMFALGNELKEHGKRVLLTTTTKILEPDESQKHDLFIVNEDIDINLDSPSVVVAGSSFFKKGKLDGFSKEYLNNKIEEDIFDFIIIEADGANRMPLKAPKEGEPVIPEKSAITIALVGLDSLGSPVDEGFVHRWEIFKDIVGCKQGDLVSPEHVMKILMDERGIFKGTPKSSERVIILNKAINEKRKALGEEIKGLIHNVNPEIVVIIR
ncbi:MAG: selenium cofactor biosynthesis protein YqeC [Firmicutes bacterium]|jgi:probable selenium-dependent hydroxylase accessory protein YqeC|nr:selenium cofactor biosynthesis protein YqeC [Bacillota bacterium]